jgi:hypothetical protein
MTRGVINQCRVLTCKLIEADSRFPSPPSPASAVAAPLPLPPRNGFHHPSILPRQAPALRSAAPDAAPPPVPAAADLRQAATSPLRGHHGVRLRPPLCRRRRPVPDDASAGVEALGGEEGGGGAEAAANTACQGREPEGGGAGEEAGDGVPGWEPGGRGAGGGGVAAVARRRRADSFEKLDKVSPAFGAYNGMN